MLIDVGRRQKHPTTTFHFPPAARFLFLCVCVCLRWESRRQKKRERWAFTKFIASDFDAAVTHALPTNHIIQLVCMRVHHLCLYRREGGGTREKAKVNQQKKNKWKEAIKMLYRLGHSLQRWWGKKESKKFFGRHSTPHS